MAVNSGKIQEAEKKKTVMRKKRRKARFKKRLLVFAFVFLCAGVILTVLKAPFFNISSIECTGQQNLTREEILRVADIDTGVNIFSVNVEAAGRKISEMPAVAESGVRRIFPNKIKIWVKESPETAYVSVGGELAVIDPNGKIISVLPGDSEVKNKLPEILGFEAVTDKPGDIISAEDDIVARQAYECIAVLDKVGLMEKISLIDLSDISNFKLSYDNRLEIYLDGYENMEYKLTFIAKVISERISDYERAKLDYRGDKLYVGPLDKDEPENTEDATEDGTDEKDTKDGSEAQESEDSGEGAEENGAANQDDKTDGEKPVTEKPEENVGDTAQNGQ